MKKIMKKIMDKSKARLSLAGGLSAFGGSVLLAQESGSSLDTTQAVQAATTIKDGLVSLAQSIAPIVVSVVLAVLSVVLIYRIVNWVMRAWRTRG